MAKEEMKHHGDAPPKQEGTGVYKPKSETVKEAIKKVCEAGFTAEKLKDLWDDTETEYAKPLRLMQLLDATDKGRLWETLNKKQPKYQLLPDTNFVARTKNSLSASIYTVQKSASIAPTSQTDKDLVTNINTYLGIIWQRENVGYFQYCAGERAALLNLGITQVGWDSDNKKIVMENVNPMRFRRDPFAKDFDHASFCLTYDYLHDRVLKADDRYGEELTNYLRKFDEGGAPNVDIMQTGVIQDISAAKHYHMITRYWVRDGKMVHEIHVLDKKEIIYAVYDIKPSFFPFSLLYCNAPAEDLIGPSPCAQILLNNIVYNMMDSIIFTAEYKNQRPPKFVNRSSGINLDTFMRHGDEADRTFIVEGDATKAVSYHQFPSTSPSLPTQLLRLIENMGNVTGIDDRYTGRDTGSITTTGGTQDMLARVTLIDAPKVLLYEEYTKRLSMLLIYNYFEHDAKRELFYQDPRTNLWKTVTVEWPKIDAKALLQNYELDISSDLPRNKQRMEFIANQLMEKQMQYGQQGQEVDLITPEEWLMMQDLGQVQEYMVDRMKVQRVMDAAKIVAQTISTYDQLMVQGIPEEQAMLQTAVALEQTRQGTAPGEVVPQEQYLPQDGGGAMM